MSLRAQTERKTAKFEKVVDKDILHLDLKAGDATDGVTIICVVTRDVCEL